MEFLENLGWVGITLAVLFLIFVAILFRFRGAIVRFFSEVRAELAKCTWPVDPEQTGMRRYKGLIDSTVVVCISSLLLAGYVAGFDFLLNSITRLLTSLG